MQVMPLTFIRTKGIEPLRIDAKNQRRTTWRCPKITPTFLFTVISSLYRLGRI